MVDKLQAFKNLQKNLHNDYQFKIKLDSLFLSVGVVAIDLKYLIECLSKYFPDYEKSEFSLEDLCIKHFNKEITEKIQGFL